MLKWVRINIYLIFQLFYYYSSAQIYQPFFISADHQGGITVMTKDPEEKYLIAGDTKGELYFHDLSSGKIVEKIKAHAAEICRLQFNSNGKLLISATHDGEIKIYDFSRGKIIQAIYSPDYSGIRFVLFSIADGFIYFNGNNRLYKTRSDLTQSVNEILNEKDTITDAVITSDRSSLIFSTGTKLKVLNTRTDQIIQEFNTGTSKINKIALVKDTLLATWSNDGTIFFWHYLLGQINPAPLFFLKAGNPTVMNFSTDGTLMSSGNIGNWARIWEPLKKTILQELFSHTNTVTSTCFGTSNDAIFTGGLDGKIILWKKGAPPPTEILAIPNLNQDSLPSEIKLSVPVKNEIEMSETNIPKIISGRKVISDLKINVDSPVINVYVYDNSYLDGDTMSLFFNGTWVLDHYGVTKTKQAVQLNLVPNTNNYLVLFANNLGKSPPNTAAIEFYDGKNKRIFKLSSDLKNCSAINFIFKK